MPTGSLEQVLPTIRDLVRQGHKEEALYVLESFLEKTPDSISAMLWYAGLTPDLEKGIQVLERVLQLDPENPYEIFATDRNRQTAFLRPGRPTEPLTG